MLKSFTYLLASIHPISRVLVVKIVLLIIHIDLLRSSFLAFSSSNLEVKKHRSHLFDIIDCQYHMKVFVLIAQS